MNNEVINLIEEAKEIYLITKTVRSVCEEMNVSSTKARKLLVSAGIRLDNYQLQCEIAKYLKDGKTQAEIVALTGYSKSCVNQNTPYTKGAYDKNIDNAFIDNDNRSKIIKSRLKKNNPLKYYRLKANITKDELASQMKVKKIDIERWENRKEIPSDIELIKIANKLKCQIEDIRRDYDERN